MADIELPCVISLSIPFPTPRLASIALGAITVDKELSPLVRRSFSLEAPPSPPAAPSSTPSAPAADDGGDAKSVLRVEYRATTNRMLRVATNSFMDSLGLVLEVMEKMDVDVLKAAGGTPVDAS